MNLLQSLLFFLVHLFIYTSTAEQELKLRVVTIATSETDGYQRFMRSAKLFDLDVEVVGMGQEWKGGDVVRFPGGGHKVNLLKPVVEQWKNEKNTVVMFVDSYDVIFTAGADVILKKFKDFNSRVVFSAEGFCWPDQSLASKYPRVGLGKRFLNSGGFMGYAAEIHAIVSDHEIADSDDDQLYYTLIYLDQQKRTEFGIRLDHRASIFQNLNGAIDEVNLMFTSNHTYAYNTIYDTNAVIYHGNGPSKLFLNSLGNYIPSTWNSTEGCIVCKEWAQQLPEDRDSWPTVLLAIFIEHPSPFLTEVLEKLALLDYPKEKMTLFVHNAAAYHEVLVSAWFEIVSEDYKESRYISSTDQMSEAEARRTALKECIEKSCDYVFSVDSLAMLDHAHTLQKLIEINRNVVSPLLVRPHRLFSNFWGAVASNGFYSRSHDYQQIIERERKGVWNVPFISMAMLISGKLLTQLKDNLPSYNSIEFDPDMTFAAWMRERGHFMYVSNLEEYGHLLNADNYETTHLHNDMYMIFDNRLDWERKYLHENWSKTLDEDYVLEQPCPDVYWYPLISEMFAKELVEEMEHYGKWSSGNNQDARIEGGYENVPTRDIHMNQGHAIMNFVVKYHPQGQSSLRPHHDSSTFTINVALSRPGIDYQGGGCRFVRYDCSVTQTRLGWTFMHPGRLTHFHEGLTVTDGTRYIMVSFIDP